MSGVIARRAKHAEAISRRACISARDCFASLAMTMARLIDLCDASHAIETHLDGRTALDRLIDHAITLGQLQQLVELLLLDIGVHREREPDLRKADRRILGDAEGAAKIKIALGGHGAG